MLLVQQIQLKQHQFVYFSPFCVIYIGLKLFFHLNDGVTCSVLCIKCTTANYTWIHTFHIQKYGYDIYAHIYWVLMQYITFLLDDLTNPLPLNHTNQRFVTRHFLSLQGTLAWEHVVLHIQKYTLSTWNWKQWVISSPCKWMIKCPTEHLNFLWPILIE